MPFCPSIFAQTGLDLYRRSFRTGAGRALTTAAIERFIARYQVNMAEAENPDPAAYATFNDFFTRALKPGARPLADADWICPVDGAISQFGRIERDQVFQAKGHSYSTTALVGGDAARAAVLTMATSPPCTSAPRDYHRIHMPCAGSSRTWCTHRAICSRSTPLRRGACLGCSRATNV